ncbi:dermonecrotic toxin domain-containing protein [Pseudomonas sp. NPDC090755]|uniref:dermonecrotic toxin domain-containing protein n=1 Tax=Pseudomonas sp. NPDC090755 TaxID=3364481 RepID=UPI00383B9FF5
MNSPENTPSVASNGQQRWTDRLTLELIEAQFDSTFEQLDQAEREQYLALSRQVPQHRLALAQALASWRQDFEQQAISDLRARLALRTGQAIDPLTTYLHTYSLEVGREWPHREVEHLQTRTLWQAALDNVGFNISWQTGSGEDFLNASSINTQAGGGRHNLLAVSTFVDIVRDLDLGARLQQQLRETLPKQLSAVSRDYHRSLLRLALLDAYRQTDDHQFNREQLQQLAQTLEHPGAVQWKYFNLKLPDGLVERALRLLPDSGVLSQLHRQLANLPFDRLNRTLLDNQLPLPFYVIKLNEAIFSYFPERPGGAWRPHVSVSEARTSLLEQLHRAQSSQQLDWLQRWLAVALQQKLGVFLQPTDVDREQLNWLARWLYDSFASASSTSQLGLIESPDSPWRQLSLLDILQREQQLTIAADLSLMASTNNSVDFDTFSRGFLYVVSEVLQLLTLPAPGGVTGLSRVMLAATLGSLGLQSVSALQALSTGHSEQAVQALADIADLLIGAKIQGIGVRLSAQRSRQLVAALGRSPTLQQRVAAQLQTATWSDTRLLEHLLPWDREMSTREIDQITRLAGASRQQLDSAWREGSELPWQVQTLLAWQRDQAEPPLTGELARRFPGLAPAPARQLVERYPQLRDLHADTLIDPQPVAALLDHQAQSRVLRTLWLLDSDNDAATPDTQAIICHLITCLDSWPEGLGIRIEENLTAPADDGFYPANASAYFGPQDNSATLVLTRTGHTYHGPNGSKPTTLIDCLRDQVPKVAGDFTNNAQLSEHLLNMALRERDILDDLLASPPLQAVSAQRLSLPARPVPAAQQVVDGQLLIDGQAHALIQGAAYPISLDPHASTPQQSVWHLIDRRHPHSPGAAILCYRDKWYYAPLPGAAGMPRGRLDALRRKNQEAASAAAQLEHTQRQEQQRRLEGINHRMNAAAEQMGDAQNRVTAAEEGSEQQQVAVEQLVTLYWKIISLTSEKISLFETQRADQVREQLIQMHLYRLQCLEKIILSRDLGINQIPADVLLDPYQGEQARYRSEHLRLIKQLEDKRPFLDRHERFIEEFHNKLPGTDSETAVSQHREQFPNTPGLLNSAVVMFKLELLAIGDPVDATAPVVLNTDIADCQTNLHDIFVALNEADSVPAAYRMALLADLHRQLERQHGTLAPLLEDLPPREKAHLKDALELLDKFEQQLQEDIGKLYQSLPANDQLSLDPHAPDYDFLPPQPGARPQPQYKRLIRVRQSGTSVLKLGATRVDDSGQVLVDIAAANDSARIQTYSKSGGSWQRVSVRPRPVQADVGEQARRLLAGVDEHLDKARRDTERKDNPTSIIERLERRAEELDELVGHLDRRNATLLEQVREAVQRLRQQGETLRIEQYKDKDNLDINRLLYLLEHHQVKVHKTLSRAPRGKGQNKHFLDVYKIRDAQGQHSPLWEAHFHYDTKTTQDDQFKTRGGHLKTLAQSHLGAQSQAQAEREGLAHKPIWRAAFSPQAARLLFAAVQPD